MKFWEAEEMAKRRLNQKRYADALAFYDRALDALPRDDVRRYAQVSILIGKARSHLGLKDPRSAFEVLSQLAREDPAGIYQGYPDYFETLTACQKALGLDCRDAENRLAELRLDWRQAQARARALLKAGHAEESLAYFERAIVSNPGEWYATAALRKAIEGKAAALQKLGRHREAEACRRQVPQGK